MIDFSEAQKNDVSIKVGLPNSIKVQARDTEIITDINRSETPGFYIYHQEAFTLEATVDTQIYDIAAVVNLIKEYCEKKGLKVSTDVTAIKFMK